MVTKAVAPKTNGDRVQPVVDRAKELLAEGVQWAREHPDEAFVAVAPWVLLTLAPGRLHLTYAEALVVAEVAYWGGVALCAQYRQWKTRPARPSLREVV
jgi:hypothetical protein